MGPVYDAVSSAVAIAATRGPASGLHELEALREPLGDYHLFHATRADLLRALGRAADARAADQHALTLAVSPAERALLRLRLEMPEG
ncbi:MAG: hypothetical protein ACR2GX_00165 [Candidatus Dormibacteria bacterium]